MNKLELTSQRIRFHVSGVAAWVTFDYQAKLNALNLGAWRDIQCAIESANRQKNVRATIITGEGRAFCVGDDLQELRELMAKRNSTVLKELFLEGIFSAVRAVIGSPKPVIAAVNGPAYGGGFELALVSDLVIASEVATFGQTELRIGAWPPITAVLGPAFLGSRYLNEIIFAGRILTAPEAYRIGLVNAVVPSCDLHSQAAAMAEDIGRGAASAVKRMKKLHQAKVSPLMKELKEAFSVMVSETCASDDFKEGINAFLEKRRPHFE